MFAVIQIPDFFLQAALRHKPDLGSKPVALMDPELSKPAIIQITAAAKDFDVFVGMTASQAVARCENLEIVARSADLEESAKAVLLQTAFAFSPNVEYTQPGVCTLELKGLGLEDPPAMQKWARTIVQTFAKLHLQVKVGIAPTPALALLAAHGEDLPKNSRITRPEPERGLQAASTSPSTATWKRPEGRAPMRAHEKAARSSRVSGGKPVIIIENAADYIATLPVAALEPSPEIMEVLTSWGIRTAGEFIALGKDKIAARLGADALELFKRVSPRANRPLNLVVPPEVFLEQMEFENEIESLEPLLFALRRFVQQLLHRLEVIHLVVGQFNLHLGLASGAKHEHIFKIPSPTADENVLFRMLHTHLENLRTDAPIVSLSLTATPVKPDMHQFGLFQNTLRNPNQFAETLARLSALVGSENVGTPVPETTHRPDTFRIDPPNFQFAPVHTNASEDQSDGLQLRRFRPPLPARVEFREDKPAHIHSEYFTGRVTGLQGPYLSSGNWWDDTRWAREEWDVQTAAGRLLRLFRSSDGCFVEGVYD